MGAACSWLMNIITLYSQLYLRYTYVYMTPLLNEIKLELRDVTHAHCSMILCVVVYSPLSALDLMSLYDERHRHHS